MIRLILSCLVALSLFGNAPAVAAMASLQPVEDCKMASGGPDPAADHAKVACCTSDCAMMGTAAPAQPDGTELSTVEPIKLVLNPLSVKELDSLDWATVDPPPRLRSS